MRKILLIILLLTLTTIVPSFASDKADNASASIEKGFLNSTEPAKDYGLGADPKDAVKISDVLADPKKYENQEITVSGLVVDVCPKRGCWMLLASDKKFQTLRIKVTDGVMVFPLSARGHKASARGKLSGRELSKEKAIEHYKHLAEEKGESFDPATVTGPLTLYMLMTSGATIQ